MARRQTETRGVPPDHGETILPLLPLSDKSMVVSTVGDISRAKDAALQSSVAEASTFDGLPWGLWQARTTLLAGLCKVTTAWHMAMVLYASTPSPFGEFRCSQRDAAAGLNHSDLNQSYLNHSDLNQSYLNYSDLVVGDGDGAFWSSGLPTASSFWDWTWEPWVPCDGETRGPNATECVTWLELRTVNQPWPVSCSSGPRPATASSWAGARSSATWWASPLAAPSA